MRETVISICMSIH